MEDHAITPRTITELKQVAPEEIAAISEGVLETNKVMGQCADEMEELSQSLYDLSATKERYDKISKQVKGQMRGIFTKL